MKNKLYYKFLLIIILFSLIPLLIIAIFSLVNISRIKDNTYLAAMSMAEELKTQSSKGLEERGGEQIIQKANDTAKMLEVYIEAHPEKTVADLQNDPYFNALAVQKVGVKGYTYVTDLETGYFYFHPQAKLVGTDSHEFKTSFPALWSIFEKTYTEKVDNRGYYDWAEADGTKTQKFMAITTLSARTADGRELLVGATTYLEEFLKPIEIMEAKINESEFKFTKDNNNIFLQTQLVFIFGFCLMVITVVFASFLITRMVIKPIIKLKETVEQVSQGKLDVEIKIDSHDEIGALAGSFNQMVKDLRQSRQELENYSKDLEKNVADRTKDLREKIEALEIFYKVAVDREIKMVELKKKIKDAEKRIKNQ